MSDHMRFSTFKTIFHFPNLHFTLWFSHPMPPFTQIPWSFLTPNCLGEITSFLLKSIQLLQTLPYIYILGLSSQNTLPSLYYPNPLIMVLTYVFCLCLPSHPPWHSLKKDLTVCQRAQGQLLTKVMLWSVISAMGTWRLNIVKGNLNQVGYRGLPPTQPKVLKSIWITMALECLIGLETMIMERMFMESHEGWDKPSRMY